jgi:endogenous inhibitor of DNA gyrase (YacG/DUF329 family)
MTDPDGPVIPLPPPARCPICRKPAVPAHRPFCSIRCARIDLARWLNGVYRVETDEPPDRLGEPDE